MIWARRVASVANFGPVFAFAAVVIGVLIGHELATGNPLGPAALAVTLGVIIFLIRPVNAGIAVLFAQYAVQRLGGTSIEPGSSGGITYADALVAAVAVIALVNLIGRRELSQIRGALIGFAVYAVALLPSLVFNSYSTGYRELVHRIILVPAAILVGAWIAREKAVGVSLRAFVCVSAVVASLAIIDSVSTGFAPASPLGINKNLVGAQLVVAALLLILLPRYIPLSLRWRAAMLTLLLAGTGLTQSRGAMVGAGISLFFALVANRSVSSRLTRTAVILLVGVIGLAVYFSVDQQLNSDNRSTNALGQRFDVEEEARRIWLKSPAVGVGMKYFTRGYNDSRFLQAPNNVVDNELAESGLIGLGGFAIFQIIVVVAGARRRDDPLAVTGAAMVFGLLVHGQVDIYWSAGSTALPYLILGIGLAAPRSDDTPASSQRSAVDQVGRKIKSSARPMTDSRV